jgi:hypothetical protein
MANGRTHPVFDGFVDFFFTATAAAGNLDQRGHSFVQNIQKAATRE